jgi:hypothetical protein
VSDPIFEMRCVRGHGWIKKNLMLPVATTNRG